MIASPSVAAGSDRPAEPAPATGPDHDVSALADVVQRMTRTLRRVRSQSLARARDDVEWSANVLIHALVQDGPMRAGALAESVQSDPSTVSRQVATLVRDGFVERRADPVDGRAALLVATAKAQEVMHAHQQMRNWHLDRVVAGWTDEDRHRLTELLSRFIDDFETYKCTLGAAGWTESAEARTGEEH